MLRPRGLFLIALLAMASIATAAVPERMNYQGRVRASGGGPVADGSYAMSFRIYNVATGGTALWSETHPGVPVTNGLFNVVLGSVNPIDQPFNAPYWLGVEFDGDGEMSPRSELTTAPYAFRAAVADSVTVAAPLSLTQASAGPPTLNVHNSAGGTAVHANSTGGGTTMIVANASGGKALSVSTTASGTTVAGEFVNHAALGRGLLGWGGTGSSNARGVEGRGYYGVFGSSSATLGRGVYAENVAGGIALAAVGGSVGVSGTASAASSKGVYGLSSGGSGSGVHGHATASGGRGVMGTADNANSYAIYGTNTLGDGVYGEAYSAGKSGVYGFSDGNGGFGVQGFATNINSRGVYGTSDNASGVGVFAEHQSSGLALRSVGNAQFDGAGNTTTFNTYVNFTAGTNLSMSISAPLSLTDSAGGATVHSANIGTGPGLLGEQLGTSSYGVHGRASAVSSMGVYGEHSAGSGIAFGVYGSAASPNGWGVSGDNAAGPGTGTGGGVKGITLQENGAGVWGENNAGSGAAVVAKGVFTGLSATASSAGGTGVYSQAGGIGVYAQGGNFGLYGYSTAGTAVYAQSVGGGLTALQAVNGAGRAAAFTGGTIGLSATASAANGIGVFASGEVAVHADGPLHMKRLFSAPTGPAALGALYYDGTVNEFRAWDGSAWGPLGGGGAAAPLSLTGTGGSTALFVTDIGGGGPVLVSATTSSPGIQVMQHSTGNAIYAANNGFGNGIYGYAASGAQAGVHGVSGNGGGYGVRAVNMALTGGTALLAENTGTIGGGTALRAQFTAGSGGTAIQALGQLVGVSATASHTANGIAGLFIGTTAVVATTDHWYGRAVKGVNQDGTANGVAIEGLAIGSSGVGVLARATSGAGSSKGLVAEGGYIGVSAVGGSLGTGTGVYASGAIAVLAQGPIDQIGQAAVPGSAAGQGRIYFDSTANRFRVSENGGGFVDLVSGGPSAPLSLTMSSTVSSPLSVSNAVGTAMLARAGAVGLSATATNAAGIAIVGRANSSAAAVQGVNDGGGAGVSGAGTAIGLLGAASAANGHGVRALVNNASAAEVGIYGQVGTGGILTALMTGGAGVVGYNTNIGGYGVYARNDMAGSSALMAYSASGNGVSITAGGTGLYVWSNGIGVSATTNAANNSVAVLGRINSNSANLYGVVGAVAGTDITTGVNAGVLGANNSTLGGPAIYAISRPGSGSSGRALAAWSDRGIAVSAVASTTNFGLAYYGRGVTGTVLEAINVGVSATASSGSGIAGYFAGSRALVMESSGPAGVSLVAKNGGLGIYVGVDTGIAIRAETGGDGGAVFARMTDASSGVGAITGQDESGSSGNFDISGVLGASNGNVGVVGLGSAGVGVYGAGLSAGGRGVFAEGMAAGLSATTASGAPTSAYAIYARSTTYEALRVDSVSALASSYAIAARHSGAGSGSVGVWAELANGASQSSAVYGRNMGNPGAGSPLYGVRGQISSLGADGKAGVYAQNSGSSVAGNPATALDVDGGITFNNARADKPFGQATITSGQQVVTIANNLAIVGSLVLVTPINPNGAANPPGANLSFYVNIPANGSLSIRTNATVPANTTVNYMIINPR